MELTGFLLTFGAALLGSLLARKCRLPAGAMTGAILAVALLNCLTGRAAVPVYTKPCMQIMGGALLGHRIGKKDLKKASGIIKAALVLIAALLALNVTIGLLVFKLTDMNLATAILATAPGGVSDMALIAGDFGADMGTVSIMQLFRMFGIYLIFPPVLRMTQKKQEQKTAGNKKGPAGYEERNRKEKIHFCLRTLVAAFLGGLFFDMMGVPAGFMVGSVVFCGAMNIGKGWGYIPENWRFYIQSVT